MRKTRREVLGAAAFGLAAWVARPLGAQDEPVEDPYRGYGAEPPAPADAPGGAGCPPTAADIEGPFYRPGAPRGAALAQGERGRPLVLEGEVVGPDCRPVAGALLDVWQADAGGRYDNDDPRRPPARDRFRLRGRVEADAAGRYRVETIFPGRYAIGPGRYRPPHIHVKVSAPGFRPLTTQLYFEGAPENEGDPWFQAARALAVREGEGGLQVATFRFALARVG